jgi:filamentous hemagglutinin family protein
MSGTQFRSACTILLWSGIILCPGLVLANPENPTIVSGNASFHNTSSSALEVTVNEQSIIHWNEFSIDSHESTHFILPNSSSVVLNRVVSGSISKINGQLSSNGNVYLINPNGILVGPTGVIDTAGFLASTLDIDTQALINFGELLFSGNSSASIINEGMITAWNGDIILLAYQVENAQTLYAPHGVVAIGCGEKILLTPAGDQRITIQIPVEQCEKPSEGIGIHQRGIIQAIQTELKADGNPYTYAIKNEGWVNATGLIVREGRVYLVAQDGLVSTSGQLSASNADGYGGEIQILGKVVTLADEAEIIASGDKGGGTILIGGDYQGNNPDIFNAHITYVSPDAVISADSFQNGNGGKVIAWADGETLFYGKVSAKGGLLGGNGGFAEISGINNLDFRGIADLTAPKGATGTLLLDPANITISTGSDTNTTFTACPTGTYVTTANSAIINIANLLTNLGSTCNISIVTTPGGSQTGTITVANAIDWTGSNTNTLTVTSASTLTFNASVTNNTTGGTMIWNSGSTTAINAAISNGPTGAPTINITSAGTITSNASGIITNSSATGTINLTTTGAAADITLGAALTESSTSGSTTLTSSRDINLNATVTNNSTSGTMIAAATRNTTFGAGAGFTGSSSGGSSFTTTTGNISTSTTSAINASGGALTFDTTPSGGTITVGGTVTFTNTATGDFTLHAQNGGDSATGLALNNTIAYSGQGAVIFTAENGNILSSAANTSMTFNPPASGTAGNVTMTATVGSITTNAATTTTFNSGAGSLSVTAGGTITLGGMTAFNSGSGQSATLMANTNIVLSNFTYNASDTLNITATTGSVTLTGASDTFQVGNLSTSGAVNVMAGTTITLGNTGLFDIGSSFPSGAVSLTAGTTITSSASSTFYLHHQATSLTMLAGTNITLVNLTYNPTSDCQLTATSGTITTSGIVNFQTAAYMTGGLIMSAGTNIATNGTLNYNAGAGAATGQGLSMTASNNVTIGGSGSINYSSAESAQLTATNGGITAAGNITFNSGSGNLTLMTNGTTTGNIALNGTTSFSAGAGSLTINANENYSNAGTINYSSFNTFAITSTLGNITTTGAINLATSAAFNMTASAGTININNLVRNTSTGPINATCSGTLFIGTGELVVPAQLGSAGGDVTIDITGNGDIQILGGEEANAFAQIGFDTGNISSNLIFTRIGGNLILLGGTDDFCYALIGHGSQIAGASGGTRMGNITFGNALNPIPGFIALTGTISNSGSAGINSFAQIGHTRSLATSPAIITGDINLSYVTGAVMATGGSLSNTYALIGHGGPLSDQPDSYTGDVLVQTSAATSFISLQSGDAAGAFCGIGHMAYMNGAGTVTIRSNTMGSNTISVIAGNYVFLTANAGAEAAIGGYVNASSGSGDISIGTVTVTTAAGSDLVMQGPVSNTAFNGTLIGALACTGAVPIVAAGTANTNTSITVGRSLAMQSGIGGTSDQTFCLIQNGSGTPSGGPFTTTIAVNDNANINGGNNITAVSSLNDLTFNVTGSLTLTSDAMTGSLGTAEVTSNGTTTITAELLTLTGFYEGPTAEIVNTTSDLTVTITGGLGMFSNTNITLSGGSGTLNVSTSVAGMLLNDNSFIQNAGTGSTIVNSAQDIMINVAVFGPSYISCLGPLTLSYGGDLTMAAADLVGDASILSAGNTTITGGEHLTMRGSPTHNQALIQNTTGDLTITTKIIDNIDTAHIELSGGSGTLSVTTTEGSISMNDDCSIQNTGTGSTTINSYSDLLIIVGVFGPSYVSTLGPLTIMCGGNLTLSATAIGDASILSTETTSITCTDHLSLTGFLTSHLALIQNTTGDLTISATAVTLQDNAKINLSGGSGALSVTATTEDLLLMHTSSIQNQGTGSTFISTDDDIQLHGDEGSGGSFILTNGDTIITAGQMLLMTGGPSGTNVYIHSQQGDLSVQATSFLECVQYADITLLGGNGTFSITAGDDCVIQNTSAIQSMGSGPFNITVGASMNLIGGLAYGSILGNTGDLTINITNNLNLVSNANGSATIQSGGNLSINTGGSCNIGGLGSGEQSLIQTTAGSLTIIADVNIAVHDNALISNTGSGTITLVVDQSSPTSIGSGKFNFDPTANIQTNGGLLRIFTAQPNGILAGNLAFGQINSNYVTAGLSCPFDAPPSSAISQYDTFYSTFSGGFGTPYTIFYKTSGPPPAPTPPPSLSPSAQRQELQNVAYASSELFFMLRKYTVFNWDSPYFVCCKSGFEKDRSRKHSFDCQLFWPGAHPTLHQNWMRYPISFPKMTSCNSFQNEEDNLTEEPTGIHPSFKLFQGNKILQIRYPSLQPDLRH